MAQSSEERTEKPTPKRLKDLRKKNTVLRSQELVTAGTLIALVAIAPMLIMNMWTAGLDVVRFSLLAAAAPDIPAALQLLSHAVYVFTVSVALPVAVVLLAAFLTSVVFTRGRPNPYAVKPRPDLLNPKMGVKRVLGVQGLIEALKGLVKLGAVALAAWTILPAAYYALLAGPPSLGDFFRVLGGFASSLAWRLALVGVAVAAFDVWWSRRKYFKQARMTKYEVKQENKQSEGDPMIKAARRQRAAQLARRRMMEDVASATVVVTNPTHIAVALRYSADDIAPVVVARGAGLIAQKIKERAALANVPVRENVPLARALYKSCRVGSVIPVELYQAVALVLAEVLRRSRRRGKVGAG